MITGQTKTNFFEAIKAHLNRNRLGELLVIQNRISAAQLREALHIQKLDPQPIGQILVKLGMIRERDIYVAISSQWAMRGLASILTALILFSSLNIGKAWANNIQDIPVRLVFASAASVDAVSSYATIWNSGERRSGDLSAFTKWSAMFSRFKDEASGSLFQKVSGEWRNELSHMRGLPLEEMASKVNAYVNQTKYIEDNKNWGRSDYWATPVEFFTRGGDCEDFAIAKYASLRILGVPDNRMRISIVKDLEKGIPHAVLIVYTNNGPMLLDNQIKRMVSANSIDHYKPIFSINRTAWWLHTAPKATTVVASR